MTDSAVAAVTASAVPTGRRSYPTVELHAMILVQDGRIERIEREFAAYREEDRRRHAEDRAYIDGAVGRIQDAVARVEDNVGTALAAHLAPMQDELGKLKEVPAMLSTLGEIVRTREERTAVLRWMGRWTTGVRGVAVYVGSVAGAVGAITAVIEKLVLHR